MPVSSGTLIKLSIYPCLCRQKTTQWNIKYSLQSTRTQIIHFLLCNSFVQLASPTYNTRSHASVDKKQQKIVFHTSFSYLYFTEKIVKLAKYHLYFTGLISIFCIIHAS